MSNNLTHFTKKCLKFFEIVDLNVHLLYNGLMVFSSLSFLWIFLPVVLLLNYLCSFIKKEKTKILCKNIVLLTSSLIFYAGGGIRYLFVMIASILGNYLFALAIDSLRAKNKAAFSKAIFVLCIIFNLGLLMYFKYTNFFVDILENIMHANFGLKEVILPIGISFFTFQAMSYVIDVYTKKAQCQKNPLLLALYISFFPQLIAGPIVKYNDIENQLLNRKETSQKFVAGIKRFLYGLAKKVIISNSVGQIAEMIFSLGAAELGANSAWLGIFAYTLQIYYDFSGYSDMAIGLGKMFGFEFSENFNYPYMALSVRDFWRRWHISLSTWFKEYVYIPLGGNRKGKWRTYLNLFIVFLLTGIWHGANFTFLLWGVFYGIFLVVERLFLGKLLEKNKLKFFNWAYTMFVVVILWVFFRADNVSVAFMYLGKMFSLSKGTFSIAENMDLWKWISLFLGVLFCGPVQMLCKKFYSKIKSKKWFFWTDFATQIVLLLICVMMLSASTFNPFIYFQF